MDNTGIALSALTVVESVQFYSAYLPSIFTIRTLGADKPDETRKQIRLGEAVASGFTIAFASLVSILLSSTMPLYFGLVTIVLATSIYEWALSTIGKEAT